MAKLKFIYSNLNKAAFWICLSFSIALIVGAFFVPPMAVIDSTVLVAVGEIFSFAALGTVIAAIDKGKGVSLTKGDTSINITNETDYESTDVQQDC